MGFMDMLAGKQPGTANFWRYLGKELLKSAIMDNQLRGGDTQK